MTTGSGSVTQIDADYLNKLKGQLDSILEGVDGQLIGIGASSSSITTTWIPAVDSTLVVLAGSPSFNAGAELNKALGTMGGSVQQQLQWLKNVLTQMISEITTTVNSFTSTESLNNETVDQLMTDFQNTISAMSDTTSASGSTTGSTGSTGSTTGSAGSTGSSGAG
jgi:hypothetical protein